MNISDGKFEIKKTYIVFAGLVLLLGTLLVYLYGRSLWFPLYVKITGGQTVEEVVEKIASKGIGISPERLAEVKHLILVGLKEERVLEVWEKRANGAASKLREYPFTGYSGGLGPKLREGDRQIPEGIYKIESLNPNSSYHLSMKLNYPNVFDREKGKEDRRKKLGYDIFIHGKSSTIGCIPIGDQAIEELFFMVAEVGVENVTVILSPYDLRTGRRQITVEEIGWEEELYDAIEAALGKEFDGTAVPDE